MTKKRRWGFLLLLLSVVFALRVSFSVGYFEGQGKGYRNFRSPVVVFESRFWAPAPSPIDDSNSTLPLPNNTRISRHASNSSLPLANDTETLGLGDEDDDPIQILNPTHLPEIHKVPKIQPIWKYLSSYLRRPRVPKDANEAMREGLRAWKEINRTMSAEANERQNSSSHTVDSKCPYFVSALNATELKSEPFLLPIPCGLVLDSSVTIVGTPGVRTGDFSFELIGSELFEEGDEPVVFHFSVRLRGDEITESPTIVQNTWTVGGDWQTEQRCPVRSECAFCSETASDGEVDGLKMCNPDIGKNISRRLGPGLWKGINVNEGTGKTWFPFAEGLPFVVTVSVGWDSFHVSVNGKHVTSFKYRLSLEPWMVNSLRIRGDLQTTSVIVNGLPISDDASLIPDLKVIRAPELPNSTTLFIGVFSSNSNFVRRMAVRRTWMQYPEVRNGTVVVRFFVGLHKNKQVNKELWTESLTYGDMQILPMVDYYNIITYKTLAICMYVEYNLKSEYVMKTDDDTFVRVDAVLSTIFESNQFKSQSSPPSLVLNSTQNLTLNSTLNSTQNLTLNSTLNLTQNLTLNSTLNSTLDFALNSTLNSTQNLTLNSTLNSSLDFALNSTDYPTQNPTHSLFMGNIDFTAQPVRDPSNKWFVNTMEWSNDTYPPWAHGPGYILSQDIAHFVVEGHKKNLLKFFKLEDVAMGIWIDQYKTLEQKVIDYVSFESYQHGSCENDYIITHYQNPSQMQCLWNNEMEGEHGICCNNEL